MSRHIEPMTEDPDETLRKLESRVAGRKMAAELFDLIREHLKDKPFMESCCEQLRLHAGLAEPQPEPEKPEPIARLGSMRMPFGGYSGLTFDDVPLDYLDWLCREQEEFYKTLRAYLRHPQLETHRGEYDGD